MKTKIFATLIIASAIIWAAVIIGSSMTLKGTECYSSIQNILVGGTLAHFAIIIAVFAWSKKKER